MRGILKAVFLNAMLAIAGNDVRAQGVRLLQRFPPAFSAGFSLSFSMAFKDAERRNKLSSLRCLEAMTLYLHSR